MSDLMVTFLQPGDVIGIALPEVIGAQATTDSERSDGSLDRRVVGGSGETHPDVCVLHDVRASTAVSEFVGAERRVTEKLRREIETATVSRPARRTAVLGDGGVRRGRPHKAFLCLPPYERTRLRRWLARRSGVTANDKPFWATRTVVEDLPRRSSTRRYS